MDLKYASRFQRHSLVRDWRQERLADAKVIVFGVGAVGNEVCRLLCLSGVGGITICDHDIIEESNLSRCALFNESDIGLKKVDAAAAAMRLLLPGVDVSPRGRPSINGVGLAEMGDCDLVISCLDSNTARLELASRCALVGAPWVDAGIRDWGGEVRPFLDPDGPCYNCGLTAEQRSLDDGNVGGCTISAEAAPIVGTTALMSSLAGSWLATIAVRFLMGLKAERDIIKFEANNPSISRVRQRRDPDCLLHTRLDDPAQVPLSNQVSVEALLSHLPENSQPMLWSPTPFKSTCILCDYEEVRWGEAFETTCAKCGGQSLQVFETTEIASAPPIISLGELGVAPREILQVFLGGERRWVELSGGG